MDLHLPLLADINLHLGVAEEAVSERSFETARTNLEKAEVSFEELRELWTEKDEHGRGLLTALAKPLRERYDAALSKLPQVAVVSEGAAEVDPEQELDPEQTPAPSA